MRIRSIKPEFWRSDDITALSREHRLLFVGLWSYVDDNGVGVDDYRAIAADLFALEDDQKEVRDFVREGLATLSRALLVARYMVDGKAYLFITSWDRHQRIDRPSKARHPRPPADWTPPTSGNDDQAQILAMDSRESPDTLDAGTGEQGNRGTGEKNSSSEIADAISDVVPPPVREDVEELCTRLRDRIADNGFKPTPRITEVWRRDARLIIDADKRDLDQALRLVDWAQSSSFWAPNVRSMAKFRQQYDTLLAQARQEQQRRQQPKRPSGRTADDKIEYLQSLKTGTGGSNVLALPRGAVQ